MWPPYIPRDPAIFDPHGNLAKHWNGVCGHKLYYKIFNTSWGSEDYSGEHWKMDPPYDDDLQAIHDLNALWKTMSAALKRTWRRIAKRHHWGLFHAFISVNVKRHTEGKDYVTSPP